MSKLLSIVIPTLNRCEYLKLTLACLLPQVKANLDEVELVVCCNASKDETDAYMQQQSKEYPFVQYKYFDEYVEVGQSLIRSVDEAQGKFVVLWGDDDIPMPYFAETILKIIKKNPEVGIIHCNRLEGKDTIYGMRNLKVVESCYDVDDEGLYPVDEFVQRFGIMLGFISSCIFRKDGWILGEPYYNDHYYGFEHLSIIVNGNRDYMCYYYPYPLEMQRLPYSRDFSVKWPLYRFVGVPNMMSDFDSAGVTKCALDRWQNTINKSFAKFIWTIMYCSQDKKFYRPRCRDLNKYQKTVVRRLLTYVIVYCCPKWLFIALKKSIYK